MSNVTFAAAFSPEDQGATVDATVRFPDDARSETCADATQFDNPIAIILRPPPVFSQDKIAIGDVIFLKVPGQSDSATAPGAEPCPL